MRRTIGSSPFKIEGQKILELEWLFDAKATH